MNDMVTVDIKTPQNEILEGSFLPLDYSVQMIIDELVDNLELPRLDETARPIAYMLRSVGQNRIFTDNETVHSAQIRNGDLLELQFLGATNGAHPAKGDSGQIAPPPPPPPPPPPYIPDGGHYSTGGNNNYPTDGSNYLPPTVAVPSEINIVLSVLDLNRNENVSLSVSRPVGDLIKQIVANYNLPARDNLNQLVKYRLFSKALGQWLDERLTLMDAQIPPLDRLALHRKEEAGSIF